MTKMLYNNLKAMNLTGALLTGTFETQSLGLVAVLFLLGSMVLGRAWIRTRDYHHTERPNPPATGIAASLRMIVETLTAAALLFLLFEKTSGGIAPFDGPDWALRSALLFLFAAVIAVGAQVLWADAKHYTFAIAVGTLITFILIGFHRSLFRGAAPPDSFTMALGIVCIFLAWRFLFGPWQPQVKATVLGTFIFWVSVHLFASEAEALRTAHMLSMIVAIVPAVIWCLLFLKEHTQRLSLVILMFFAGMLSTAPILFYDTLVRRNTELQFFLFKITPENFASTSSAFVSGNLASFTGLRSTLAATLLSFLIVGFIEETSKFWVLRKSGERFFSSIDDVLQLGIIVAIGFAFAENVLNPSYFVGFVREYIMASGGPNWGGFLGNVLGRAILTNMVHILSSGVLAYFYGLALFAGPLLEETTRHGLGHPFADLLHRLFRLPTKAVFRRQMLIMGFLAALALHGLFNFLVTLPDLLPGNPRTLGDLVGAAPGSPLHLIALLVVPSLFYVVGGFWILSLLFERKESMKERGCLVTVDTFVRPEQALA